MTEPTEAMEACPPDWALERADDLFEAEAWPDDISMAERHRRAFARYLSRLTPVSAEGLAELIEASDGGEPFVVLKDTDGNWMTRTLEAHEALARPATSGLADEHETVAVDRPVYDEIARIRAAIVPSDGSDKEDLIAYAKEITALRATPAPDGLRTLAQLAQRYLHEGSDPEDPTCQELETAISHALRNTEKPDDE